MPCGRVAPFHLAYAGGPDSQAENLGLFVVLWYGMASSIVLWPKLWGRFKKSTENNMKYLFPKVVPIDSRSQIGLQNDMGGTCGGIAIQPVHKLDMGA